MMKLLRFRNPGTQYATHIHIIKQLYNRVGEQAYFTLGDMAKQGQIAGVGIAHRGDTKYLKSIPDGSENNNLGNLPSVSPDTQG